MYRKPMASGIVLLFIVSSLIPMVSSYTPYSDNIICGFNDGTLSGYVKDTFMNPIEGAIVRVNFHDTYEENFTDSSGYYHVTNIPICYCMKNATASKEGYKTEWVLLSIDETTTYNFVLPRLANKLYVGGTGPDNYSKIQDAVDNASDGDIVFVYSGIYYENVIIENSITILGEDRNNTIIDGGESYYVIRIRTHNIKINNFTLINSDNKTGSGIGIRSEVNNISIIGNIFTGFNYGIKIEDSSNIEIIDNNIHHNRYGGISISDSSNFIIKYNNVTYSYDDEYNGEGIGLINSENISISFNKIMYNVCGFTIIKSSNNNISHNNIKGNSYCGIDIWWTTDKKSNNNLFLNNNIENSKYGIKLDCDKNKIINNNFIENNIQAYFYGFKNHWRGNYWNKKMIFPVPIFGRLGANGILHQIPWVNFDWRPAKEPYDIPIPG